jgi:hypothetical protein
MNRQLLAELLNMFGFVNLLWPRFGTSATRGRIKSAFPVLEVMLRLPLAPARVG